MCGREGGEGNAWEEKNVRKKEVKVERFTQVQA